MGDRMTYAKLEPTPGRQCKDCEPGSMRPAPHPGPRCTTHHRAEIKRIKAVQRARATQRRYGVTEDEDQAVLDEQGGRCAGCRRANGASKDLAHDHDHKTGWFRGRLCSTCNQIVGHFRDDPVALIRFAQYLINPPAYAIIGRVSPTERIPPHAHKEPPGLSLEDVPPLS